MPDSKVYKGHPGARDKDYTALDSQNLAQLNRILKKNDPKIKGIWDIEPDFAFLCDEDEILLHAHRAVLMQKSLFFQLLLEGTSITEQN